MAAVAAGTCATTTTTSCEHRWRVDRLLVYCCYLANSCVYLPFYCLCFPSSCFYSPIYSLYLPSSTCRLLNGVLFMILDYA
eukprot:6208459-Pleurochrysis_carterae.AAC.1